jgi:hypothetical protein
MQHGVPVGSPGGTKKSETLISKSYFLNNGRAFPLKTLKKSWAARGRQPDMQGLHQNCPRVVSRTPRGNFF